MYLGVATEPGKQRVRDQQVGPQGLEGEIALESEVTDQEHLGNPTPADHRAQLVVVSQSPLQSGEVPRHRRGQRCRALAGVAIDLLRGSRSAHKAESSPDGKPRLAGGTGLGGRGPQVARGEDELWLPPRQEAVKPSRAEPRRR